MNIAIVAADNELIAYLPDKGKRIIKDGYELINFGESEPVFEDIGGKVYVKDNVYVVYYGERSGD